MVWHEIVKYSPQKYNRNEVYTADEWTSSRMEKVCYLCQTIQYQSDESSYAQSLISDFA